MAGHDALQSEAAGFATLERELMVTTRAHQRWLRHCVVAAGLRDAGLAEATVFHHFACGGSEADLCELGPALGFQGDYSLRSVLHRLESRDVLFRLGTTTGAVRYALTAQGMVLAQRYRELRRACLVRGSAAPVQENQALLAQSLHALAARFASGAALVASL